MFGMGGGGGGGFSHCFAGSDVSGLSAITLTA